MDEDEYNYAAAAEAEAAQQAAYEEMAAAAHADFQADQQAQYECELAAAQAEAQAIENEIPEFLYFVTEALEEQNIEKLAGLASALAAALLAACGGDAKLADCVFLKSAKMVVEAAEEEAAANEDPKSAVAPQTASTKPGSGANPAGEASSEVESNG